MPSYNVTLKNSQLSNDGQVVRLNTTSDNGQEVSLSFSADEIDMMMLALVQVATTSGQIRHNDRTLKKVLPCEWWEVNPHPDLNSSQQTGKCLGS